LVHSDTTVGTITMDEEAQWTEMEGWRAGFDLLYARKAARYRVVGVEGRTVRTS
jgi:hypothetical protein